MPAVFNFISRGHSAKNKPAYNLIKTSLISKHSNPLCLVVIDTFIQFLLSI